MLQPHTPSQMFGAAPIVGAVSRCAAERRPLICQDMPFVIRRDGVWLYRGSPIQRKELVCLFASVLTRDESGGFLLETPVERGRIVVEDAPFVAVELDWGMCANGNQYLSFRLNTDQVITLGRNHGMRLAAGPSEDERIPYIHVRDGQGAYPVEARICRAVYYEMVALAVPHVMDGQEMLGVWSAGAFFPLGPLPREEHAGHSEDARISIA